MPHEDYSVVVINPLLINNFSKRSLRKTKTDKKDALTIAQFLLQEKETLSVKTPDYLITELKDMARRREKLADHMTSLKGNMKRILSVTFPELEYITGVFTKSTLRLLTQYPSAHAIKESRAMLSCGCLYQSGPGATNLAPPSRCLWTPPRHQSV